MKNSVKVIILLFCVINFNIPAVFSAMDDEMSADRDKVLDDIVYEREQAKLEYQRYIRERQSTQKPVVAARVEKDIIHIEDTSTKKTFSIGLALIAVALLLLVYLHKSKNNTKKN